ncbi:MAG: SLC13 family permease [Planctomycetaceae bacterium]|nr:SLC13 family permease [Planctomycetaceae bacterium]
MEIESWFTLAVLAVMVIALARNVATDLAMVAVLAVFMTAGLFSDKFPGPSKLVAGLGNEALVTVLVLYVVVAGLSRTGAMNLVTRPLLGRPRNVTSAQLRLMIPCAGLSAFLNNTPIVAMFLPVVSDLAKRTGIAPSKLFIPLSYSTILGGVCTLIGTSTNMVVYGLAVGELGRRDVFNMFELAWVGIPCAIAGITFLVVTGRWLLPERKPSISVTGDPREYTVEMEVEAGSAYVGQTIEAAGLRGLPGMYLAEIEREGRVLPAVGSSEVLRASDRLVFVGIVDSVLDLQKLRGLRPATNQVFKLDAPRSERCMIEAVVSPHNPLVGQTIRDGRFRAVYNAAVIAVARQGERLRQKIGDIVLQPGDTLLLEAHPSFADQQRNSRDFFLVSRLEDSTPPGHEKAWLAIAILVAMVVVAGFEWLSMVHVGLLAAGAMLVTGCCNANAARRSIDWEVLITIAAALGIGETMRSTGLAHEIAVGATSAIGNHPMAALATLYGVTMLLTELLSNNATAALMYPIAMATANQLGLDYHPFLIAIMFAASCGFATPFGYQTNLMVYGPGGYRFSDFLRVGIALDLLVMAVALAVIPFAFPLVPSVPS